MNIRPNIKTGISVCPHDCPSACALEVELLDEKTIGRVRGAKDNAYTLGVICEKVGRYAERIHHPNRLRYPLKRTGPKGRDQFTRARLVGCCHRILQVEDHRVRPALIDFAELLLAVAGDEQHRAQRGAISGWWRIVHDGIPLDVLPAH